jgi:hypothetical protein
MQDSYTGDIGDFGKYALLNALAADALNWAWSGIYTRTAK